MNEIWISEENPGITVISTFSPTLKSLLTIYFSFFRLNFLPSFLTSCLSGRVRWSKTTSKWPVPATQADIHFCIHPYYYSQEWAAGMWPLLPWCPLLWLFIYSASASVKAALCFARPIPALHILAWSTSDRMSGPVWGLVSEGCCLAS